MPGKNTGLILAAVALAVLLGGCYPNPAPPGLTPIPTLAPAPTLAVVAAVTVAPTAAARPAGAAPQGNAQEGQQVFAQTCVGCHGPDGGGSQVGPALKNSKFVQTGGDKVFQTIANGRPGTAMPAWSQAKGGKLSDAQIYNVIAYLQTLQK